MRCLFLGDIVGKPGVQGVLRNLPALRREQKFDLVVANAENAADGSGLTKRQFKQLVDEDQLDAITMGDHVYRKSELYEILDTDSRIVRPANFPETAPGKGWTVVKTKSQTPVAISCFLGRVFMRPVDCPFLAADLVLSEIPENVKIHIVDFHAEATSDKQLFAHYLDGRVSAVLGTHTHVPTADARLSPLGTGMITDVGMTGPYASIIGRAIPPVLEATLSFKPQHYHVAKDDVRLCGVQLEIDESTGKTIWIQRFEHCL